VFASTHMIGPSKLLHSIVNDLSRGSRVASGKVYFAPDGGLMAYGLWLMA